VVDPKAVAYESLRLASQLKSTSNGYCSIGNELGITAAEVFGSMWLTVILTLDVMCCDKKISTHQCLLGLMLHKLMIMLATSRRKHNVMV